MITPRLESRNPRLRYPYLNISVADPFFWSIDFFSFPFSFLRRNGGNEWKIIHDHLWRVYYSFDFFSFFSSRFLSGMINGGFHFSIRILPEGSLMIFSLLATLFCFCFLIPFIALFLKTSVNISKIMERMVDGRNFE